MARVLGGRTLGHALLVGLVAVTAAGCSSPAAGDAASAPSALAPIVSDPGKGPTADLLPSASPTASVRPNVPLYLVDVNTSNDLAAALPTGMLAGVQGTIPGAAVPQSFLESLQQVDPGLASDAYAAEAYDAVVLAALGTLAADSDAGRDIAAELVPLTNGTTPCSGFAECARLIEAGTSVAYEGRSGPTRLSPTGEPTSATIGVYTFGPDNQLRPDVEYVDVAVDPAVAAAPGRAARQRGAGDGVLTVGTLLPATGTLAFMRPAQSAGVELAVRDIAAAGGIPGIDRVAVVHADAGDDAKSAQAGLRQLLKAGVDVIVGPGATTTAGGVVPQATTAGVLYLAPVNSSLTPVRNRYDGLYWRMSPSSLAQGTLLGERIAAEGRHRVAIVHADNEYADALAQEIASATTRSGGRVVANAGYDAAAVDFAGVVARVKKADPDAIALVGFDESAQVIYELVRQGIGPNSAT